MPPRPPPKVEDADDLDDLDDILDQFSAPGSSAAAGPPPPPPPTRNVPSPPSEVAQAEMLRRMMQELTEGAALGDGDDEDGDVGGDEELERLARMFSGFGLGQGADGAPGDAELSAALSPLMDMLKDLNPEDMMRELAEGFPDPDDLPLPDAPMVAGPPRPPPPAQPSLPIATTSTSTTTTTTATTISPLQTIATSSTTTTTTATLTAAAAPPQSAAFQSAVSSTLARLRASDSAASADSSHPPSDPLADLLGSLGGEGGEEGMQGMLESMMRRLLSKPVLYDPLKELSTRYPAYLESQKDLPADDMAKHRAQQACIDGLVRIFEDPEYEDDDAEWGMKVVEGMNSLQELGPPPKELMGDLPEGFGFGENGLPNLGSGQEGCFVA